MGTVLFVFLCEEGSALLPTGRSSPLTRGGCHAALARSIAGAPGVKKRPDTSAATRGSPVVSKKYKEIISLFQAQKDLKSTMGDPNLKLAFSLEFQGLERIIRYDRMVPSQESSDSRLARPETFLLHPYRLGR